jgi:hypothetical protein
MSWWLTPVIPATQEAEIRGITVQIQPGQIVHETLSQKSSSQKKGWCHGSSNKRASLASVRLWVQTPVPPLKTKKYIKLKTHSTKEAEWPIWYAGSITCNTVLHTVCESLYMYSHSIKAHESKKTTNLNSKCQWRRS